MTPGTRTAPTLGGRPSRSFIFLPSSFTPLTLEPRLEAPRRLAVTADRLTQTLEGTLKWQTRLMDETTRPVAVRRWWGLISYLAMRLKRRLGGSSSLEPPYLQAEGFDRFLPPVGPAAVVLPCAETW